MRLLIADDHTLFRKSLRALMEANGMDVVGEAESGSQALELAAELQPDLVLMDLEMPDLNGFDATRQLTADHPRIRVVVLTGSFDEDYLVKALQAGARGYLVKTLQPDELFSMLEAVLAGETAFSPGLAQKALTRLAQRGQEETGGGRKDPMELTGREEEVLCWMAGGVTSTRALAEKLGVTERTVKFHIGNLLEKLQVGSRAEAVSVALRKKLVEPKG